MKANNNNQRITETSLVINRTRPIVKFEGNLMVRAPHNECSHWEVSFIEHDPYGDICVIDFYEVKGTMEAVIEGAKNDPLYSYGRVEIIGLF